MLVNKENVSEQISKKNMQAWTLRDILHAGGLPPMEDNDDMGEYFSPPPMMDPTLVRHTTIF